jgi:DNA uptake protein ComE-like DNA-binding protein
MVCLLLCSHPTAAMHRSQIQMAKVYQKNKESVAALQHYKQALALVPDNAKLQAKVAGLEQEIAANAQTMPPPLASFADMGVAGNKAAAHPAQSKTQAAKAGLSVLQDPIANPKHQSAKRRSDPHAAPQPTVVKQAAPVQRQRSGSGTQRGLTQRTVDSNIRTAVGAAKKSKPLGVSVFKGGIKSVVKETVPQANSDDEDWRPADSDAETDDGASPPRSAGLNTTFTLPSPSSVLPTVAKSAALSPASVLRCLQQGNLKALMALNGVGKKRAEAIVAYRATADIAQVSLFVGWGAVGC